MSTPALEPAEGMRWYTRALKIPRLIGKLPSGERIKGGPYRQSQAYTFVTIVVVGHLTMSWWGMGGFFTNWGALLAVAAGAGAAAKYLPIGTVNPVVMAGGAVRMAGRSRSARWCGVQVRPAGSGVATARVTITEVLDLPSAATSAPKAAPSTTTTALERPAGQAVAAPADKLATLLSLRSHQSCH